MIRFELALWAPSRSAISAVCIRAVMEDLVRFWEGDGIPRRPSTAQLSIFLHRLRLIIAWDTDILTPELVRTFMLE